MWKAYIKPVALLGCLALAACASGPSTPSGENAANVKVDPQAQVEFNQALQALKTGRDDDALGMLKEITQKYPSLAGPYTNLGLVYIKKGKFAEAKQALLQATTIKPGDAVAYNHLGVAYRELGEFKQAQQAYEEALKLKPDYADAHLNIGILYDVYLNDLNQALLQYQQYQSLSSSPDPKVEKWIVDLNRRVGKNQAKAAP
jgi:Flp pilus assembly protein TadD